ncbi:MAG: filamentous hemagglutinin N-terminal domain-containing protein, partial [Nitrospirae bacterium]
MNKIYRLIWSKVKERMVIVSEIVKGKGGPSPVTVVAATGMISLFMALTPTGIYALPIGQQVVSGSATFDKQGNTLTIKNSPNAIINWQGFSINTNETTRFIQQSSSSAVLNRVVGQDPSSILGALLSNGHVFLINPNGIFFGKGATIDVNGLIASTLNLSNHDFLAGKYNFNAGINAGQIKNEGTITTPQGGRVYLVAPDIENSGIITSPKGEIMLAAGKSVNLVDSTNPDISVVVSAPEHTALNVGQIVAESGKVGIYAGLIRNKGIVSANSAVIGENGKIIFKAVKDVTLEQDSVISAKGGTIKVLGSMEDGTVKVGGILDASAPNIPSPLAGEGANGGFIETSAARVEINNPTVTAASPYGKGGQWLIDPTDITIDAAYAGTIAGTLNAGTDVTVQTDAAGAQQGNITVSSAISKTAGGNATLVLSAHNNININAGISSTSGVLNLTLNANSDAAGGGTSNLSSATLDLNGGTLSLGAQLNLSNTASIKNASVTSGTSGLWLNQGQTATLNGVTLNAPMTQDWQSTLNISNGLT